MKYIVSKYSTKMAKNGEVVAVCQSLDVALAESRNNGWKASEYSIVESASSAFRIGDVLTNRVSVGGIVVPVIVGAAS